MSKIDLSNWLLIIPARLASTRLARKPLQILAGKPLVVVVWEKVRNLEQLGAKVLVAIDSMQVADVLNTWQVPFIMTEPELASGTDRVFAASNKFDYKYVMNIQGDEPFIEEEDIKTLCTEFEAAARSRDAKMGTLIFRSTSAEKFSQPQIVKVVIDDQKNALYFSRAQIPFPRDGGFSWFWQHLGIYAFTKKAIAEFVNLPASSLEQTEKLEQLRAVEAGWSIVTSVAKTESWGIDTPEDLKLAASILEKNCDR